MKYAFDPALDQPTVEAQLRQAHLTLTRVLEDKELLANVEKAAKTIAQALKNDKKVISCGNGGSHCDSMHFAEELTGRFRNDRPSYAAIAISDVSHLSCVGNDYGYEYVFSRYLEGVGKAGDCFFAISTSGNSKNVINACKVARAKGMTVIGLTGKDGGQMAQENLMDIELRVPHFGYADRIQEVHIKFIHIIIMLIEKEMAQVA